ncbi:MAG: HAD family phosphatase [Thiotrichales bacterium]|nr:MAG: HAD family phosphatase [Thiotrichales bacterium]
MRKIKAILFDFGGVLAEEGFSIGLQALAREQSLPVDDMTEEGMRAVYDSGFVLGKGSESDFWSLLRERTGLRGDDDELHARLFDGFIMRPWMISLVDELRSQGYITGILSDQTDWLDRLDARFGFGQHFDHIYNSYCMGKGKRDPTHFNDVAEDLGLEPASILLVDDSRINVDTALATGMQVIQYTNREEFEDSLGKLLILHKNTGSTN